MFVLPNKSSVCLSVNIIHLLCFKKKLTLLPVKIKKPIEKLSWSNEAASNAVSKTDL